MFEDPCRVTPALGEAGIGATRPSEGGANSAGGPSLEGDPRLGNPPRSGQGEGAPAAPWPTRGGAERRRLPGEAG